MSAKFTATDAASFLGVTVQAIHKQLKKHNLPFEKTQNRVYFGHTTSRALFQLQFEPKILGFQIVKGGTGKTSIAHATAIRAHSYGARVLCIDLDQQGNLTQALQVDAEETPVMVDILTQGLDIKDAIIPVEEGLDLLPSRIENAVLDNTIMLGSYPLDRVYKDRFKKIKTMYDLIVIDCPPALGQSVAAVALASDMIIAPVTPEEFSLSGLKLSVQEMGNIERKFGIKIPLRIVLNKFDTRTTLSHEVLSTLIKHPIFAEQIFKSYIRASQEFPNSITRLESIFDNIKNTPAKEDIDLLTQEILGIQKPSASEVNLGKLEAVS